jgi:hypothetical protein
MKLIEQYLLNQIVSGYLDIYDALSINMSLLEHT